jgi:ABC-type transport system involved in cytochrome c biogenesis permease subunit
MGPIRAATLPQSLFSLALVAASLAPVASAYAADTFTPDSRLIALDESIDWSNARLIAVQDGNRYKTLDSFARETMAAMYGKEHLPRLSPLASMFEWLFNRDAYRDVPLIRIRDMGLRIHFTAHMPAEQAGRIRESGYMTLEEFTSRTVQQRKDELRPKAHMGPAMRRIGEAEATAIGLDQIIRIVPRPAGPEHALWLTPDELYPNLPESYRAAAASREIQFRMDPMRRVADVPEDIAESVLAAWTRIDEGWRTRDAAKVREGLDRLVVRLPAIAGTQTEYPSLAQREAEAKYYAMGKFTWGWGAYFIGAIASIWALITRWRWSFVLGQFWLLVGLAIHAYGIALRWQIVGYIPVSNMFEAVTGSAWMGISIILALELTDRFRGMSKPGRSILAGAYALVATGLSFFATKAIWFRGYGPSFSIDSVVLVSATFVILGLYAYLLVSSFRGLPTMFYKPAMRPVLLMAANVTGFFALILAAYVIPGGGTLSSIRAILDDVMLRIHTTLIIASYALIFLASVVAVVYLFGYYFRVAPQASMEVGIVIVMAGASLWFLSGSAFAQVEGRNQTISGFIKPTHITVLGWCLTVLMAALVALFAGLRVPRSWLAAAAVLGVACLTLAVGDRGFVRGMGMTLTGVGAAWTIGMLLARLLSTTESRTPALALAGAGPSPSTLPAVLERPVLAGGAPGDEHQRALPHWLHDFDWCHLIILNLVFIMLFVGIILGAIWADYSWGRPWGWDPKEVFALNTWIVYAILIHSRFVATNKGLWTAWLSIGGCLMMAFNWCFVNFYIVGLHSYA